MQAYPVSKLPHEKVTIRKGSYHFYRICDCNFCIFNMDDQTTPYLGINFLFNHGEVEMLPGEHKVTVYRFASCLGGSDRGYNQASSFVAEAGHVYKVDGTCFLVDNIWIIDTTTDRVVSGCKF